MVVALLIFIAMVGWSTFGIVSLAAVIAVVNMALYGAAIWGFRASLRTAGEATWWFILGFAIVAGAIILRGMYWDFGLPSLRILAPSAAEVWSNATQGRLINNLFGSMKLVGIMCVLRCRQLLVPDHERHLWPLHKAWMHPNELKLWRWWI